VYFGCDCNKYTQVLLCASSPQINDKNPLMPKGAHRVLKCGSLNGLATNVSKHLIDQSEKKISLIDQLRQGMF